jgi:WD40 repeat protein
MNQLQTGNPELADLLSYASYTFSDRYHGDIYNPAVYQALVMTSQSKNSWNKHKGATRCVKFRLGDNHFLTCSSYGEVMEHYLSNNQLNSKVLFSNKQYDFRDVYILENNDIYVADRNGRILMISHQGQQKVLLLDSNDKLLGLTPIGNQLLVIGERTLSVIDTQQKIISNSRKLNFRIVSFCRYDNSPVVFDDQERMHIVRGLDRLDSSQVPFKGQVTAFASSKNTGLKAYGLRGGTICLVRPNGKSVRLVGHRSQVSKIKINGMRIYSSSYDGNLILWAADQEKIEPITLFTTQSWIMDFNFDNKKEYIWAVDQKGNITEAFISVPKMVDKLRNKLKRNLTQDEWDYYVGRNIPYERFLNR